MKSSTLLIALLSLAAPAWPSAASGQEEDKKEAVEAPPDESTPAEKSAEPPATAPGEAPIETEPGYDRSITRGLSWDLMAGGIPESGGLIEGALGFSGLPRVAYHYSLSPEMSVGGMLAFDYAYWAPDRAFAGSMFIQGPIRMTLHRSSSLSIGARFDPGIGLFFAGERRSQFALGLLLNAGASVGLTIENRMVIGGAVNVPMLFLIPTGGADTVLTIPLLFGPIFELHVTPPLALTVDAGIGPQLNTSGGTAFGLRLMAGIAYRL